MTQDRTARRNDEHLDEHGGYGEHDAYDGGHTDGHDGGHDGDYEISTDPARLDLGLVHHWLSTDAYWARGRSRDVVETSVRNSLNFGVYGPAGRQVGYARVVTDRATFAWLCDVYIAREHRGRGLGRRLVAAVRDRLAPYALQRVLLATDDAHELYAGAGFTAFPHPEKLMLLAGPPR